MFIRSYILGHQTHPHFFTNTQIKSFMDRNYLSKKDEDLLKLNKLLSDPTRYKIYQLLKKAKEISVSDIANILDLPHSTVSHSLSDLVKLRMVKAKRCGKLICYSLWK